MTILVTGGAGFIGSIIVEEFLKLHHEVIVLDDLSGGFIENVPTEAIFVQGSITNATFVNQLFDKYHFEYVFHCAAYAAEVLSHHIRNFNYENNVIGSINLINAAVNHEIKCFVFTSSAAVYGNNCTPFHENLTPLPMDPYGIAKLTVEFDLKAANIYFNLPYIIFRLHNVYGEHQNISDKYRNVVGIFMNQLLLDKPLTIFGDGTQTRSFSYIRDIVPVIVNSINRPDMYNDVYNLGSDQNINLNDLATLVASVMGKRSKIQYLRPRHEVINSCVSHEKIKKIFGILQETPLEIGVTKMFEWVKRYGEVRSPQFFNNVEIKCKLPESWLATNESTRIESNTISSQKE